MPNEPVCITPTTHETLANLNIQSCLQRKLAIAKQLILKDMKVNKK